eukprot:2316058-Pleurochrysis_carterae.AAC.1
MPAEIHRMMPTRVSCRLYVRACACMHACVCARTRARYASGCGPRDRTAISSTMHPRGIPMRSAWRSAHLRNQHTTVSSKMCARADEERAEIAFRVRIT